MIIKIRDLYKTFMKGDNKIEVLKGLNLDIDQGESLAILGVSGAGKSTLIHILGTLDHPSQGQVIYDGLDIFSWEEKKLASFRNRKIGFVFQFNNLLPEFTCLENTILPALIHGISRKEAKEKGEKILDQVGLGHRLTHKPGELSGGEQQRAAVARALIMEPDVILADEPTGNLDSETGRKIEDILIALNKNRKMTLIVVTHNQSLANRLSRSIGLKDGRIYSCD